MADDRFEQILARGLPLILDGGLATELESRGFKLDSVLWSAELLLNNEQAIIDVHRAYLEAGAGCIISASYQATQAGFIALGATANDAR